ncbi:MAG: PQQ-binding-like beta-propeller repeat protein [Gemmatimonadales bacterium]
MLAAALWTVNAIACAAVGRPGPVRQETGWPLYLGGPRHDASADETLNADPQPLWHVDAGRAVRGAPALGETVLVVGTAERHVLLFDRASGETIWRQRLRGTIHAGPLLDGDRIYVATEQPDGRVYALRLQDGRTVWATSAGSITAPPALEGDALYAGTETGVVYRLDTEEGRVLWRRALPGGAAIRAAPVPTPHGIVVATTSDSLYLLDRETGQIRSRRATPGAILGTPATEGTRLFLGTTGGHVLEVSLPGFELRWDQPAGDAVLGAPALARDTLYVLARSGGLWVIPLATPSAARVHPLDVVATAGPTPTASGVLVGSVSGEILLVDPGTGSVRWRARVDGPIEQPPIVRDRQLVVVAGRGDIHAYR